MKSIYTLLIPLLLVPFFAFAQPKNNLLGDVTMPAPTVSNLLAFSDIPIAYQTGVPSIDIPLYTVQEGALSLPISLNYHAAGIRPATNASWVGDWTLMAGGSITRTVMNAPDERTFGYYFIGETLAPSNVERGDSALSMANGQIDSEPDIFAYSFAGYSGKFFFDADSKNTNKVRFVTQNNLKLEWSLSGNNWQHFTIITPDGTRYIFGNIPGTSITAYEETGKTFTVPDRSTWHLLRIQSYDGNYKIDFSYQDDWSAYKVPASCKYVYSECQTSSQQGGTGGGSAFNNYVFYDQKSCSSNASDGINHPWIKMANKGKRLSAISTPNCQVNFVADTAREDVEIHPDGINRSRRLDRIEVISGAYQFDYRFSYDYWYDDSNIPGYTWSAATQQNQPEFKRLRLNRLQKIAADNSQQEAPYYFAYEIKENEPDYFPFRLTKAVDHWGFFSDAEGNNSRNLNIPKTIVYGNNSTLTYDDQVDRESDSTAVKYGVLRQIQYPTGGTANFEFEANSVPTVVSGTQQGLLTALSCTAPDSPNCCNEASDTVGFTFISQDQINNAVFELCLEATVPPSGGTGLNCTDSSTDDVVTARVDIIDSSTDRIVGGWGFGIEESLATNGGFCPIVSDGAPLDEILYPGETLDTNIQYNFAVVTDNAFGIFSLRTLGDLEFADRTVGGLRIKKVTYSDSIAVANNIIKTYDYRLEGADSVRSSGVLVQEPEYGYFLEVNSGGSINNFNQSLTGAAVVFRAESIVPLSSFEGYHVRYQTVTEAHNGNGKSIYRNRIEPYIPPPAEFFPTPPEQVRLRDGKTEEKEHYRANETLVSSEFITPDFAYTNAPGFVAKVAKTELQCTNGSSGGTFDIIGYTPYTNRVGYYLPGTVTNMLDGVETTTEYEYDHAGGLRHLFPTATKLTNSDGVEYISRNTYVFDLGGSNVYNEMVDSNIIQNPIETELQVDEGNGIYQIGGVRTDYSFFDANGLPVAVNMGDAEPYPHELLSYKRTFDKDGNLTAGFWELEATVEERYTDSDPSKAGYRKIVQTADWSLKDTLDWYHGILLSHTFGEHQRSRSFHPNTRLIASSTDIDGQPVFFNYDQLMRVDTILARPKTANPNPANTDDFNVVTTAEYVYPQMAGDRAYTRTRIDYAAEPTGNSQYRFRESYAYLDGLGRLIQSIERQHSPDTLDVLVAQEWDNQNRISRVYEPYEISQNTGAFVDPIPLFAQQRYTETRYFNSPLNRVRGTTPPNWFETLM
ncbi:MAG: DUF6443 domain-containing protein, partial [Bacteroidota bacterium]